MIGKTLDRIAPESEAVDLCDLATYARGYLDAESKYRRMIEDGELVEVVRCKDCKYAHMTYAGECKYCDIWFPDEPAYADGTFYCAAGERRTDEQT